MKYCYILINCISIFFFLAIKAHGQETSLYFKVSLDGQNYYETIITNFRALDSKLEYLATHLIEKGLNIEDINTDYYQVNIYYNVHYLDRDLDIYNFIPIFNDRFRHVISVKNNIVFGEEVYDLYNKLLYSYSFLKLDIGKQKKMKKKPPLLPKNSIILSYYKGFKPIYKKVDKNILHILYSDGLNRFSIFRKKLNNANSFQESKIVLGNYVYRVTKNGYVYAIVGTIPFKEMKKLVNFYIKKEELQK